ncbi:MAG: methyltransferase domain-containing protein [Candidatus Sumerlaeia bacterium]
MTDKTLNNIIKYYSFGYELNRLESSGQGILERIRTMSLLTRNLPAAPATVLDIGGATGAYSFALAEMGYRVHLVDIVPLHVEKALERNAQAGAKLAGATVGDGRHLQFDDACADACLLMGPLYHLTNKPDRIRALAEARRCLKPGGVLFAAAISKFASLAEVMADPADDLFCEIVKDDLASGQHRNRGKLEYFTDAYFHHPAQLEEEVREAGFEPVVLHAVEGPEWLAPQLTGNLENEKTRQTILSLIEQVETEPSIMGASAHIMAIARNPEAAS